jgi:hypothetical protein
MARLAISIIPKIKRGIILFQFLSFVLMVVFFATGARVSAGGMVVFLLQGVVGFVFLTILNNAAQDHFLAAEGVAVGPLFKRRRTSQAAVLLMVGVGLVLLFARRTSVFPLSIFGPLLEWLRSLMDREMEIGPPPPVRPNIPRPQQDLMDLLELGDRDPNPWVEILRFILRVIWNVIKWAGLVVLGYLLISPFLSRYFRTRLRGLRPLAFLLEQAKALGSFLRRIWEDLAAWLRRPPAERQERRRQRRREWIRTVRVRRPGMFKRMEMGRVLRAYVRLIRWGGRRGVSFRVSYAPREYADQLKERLPEHAGALEEAMVILEQALFSPVRIGRQRVGVYLKRIREITGKRV